MRSESLQILEPCSADWERMDGDGTVRFCRLCKKNVHDLSAMTEAEAVAFLSGGDQPCIRYLHDARGDVLFTDRPGLFSRLAASAALAFGGLVAGGCMGKPACPGPPTAEQPPVEQPDEPIPEQPAAEQPAAEQPADEEPPPAADAE